MVFVFVAVIGYFIISWLLSFGLGAFAGRSRGLMMPVSIFIVTTVYCLVGIIWFLSAKDRSAIHWIVGIGSVIFWLGIYGKVAIKRPEPENVGLAIVLGTPVAHIFRPGINFLWQRGQRFIGVDMITIPGQIANRELLFDGIPALQKKQVGLPTGSIKINYAIRWRINFEDPQAALQFFWNGLTEGVFAFLSDKGSIISQALRQLAKKTEYEVLLQEDPTLFVPMVANLLFGTPADTMPVIPPEGMPDILGLGIRAFSFGLTEVAVDKKDSAEVIKDRMAAQGIAAMAETLKDSGLSEAMIAKFIALQKGAKGTVVFSDKGTSLFMGLGRGVVPPQNQQEQDDDDDDDNQSQ